MKKYNFHIIVGGVLVILLAMYILLSKFKYSKDYEIVDEFTETKNNVTSVLAFVKAQSFDVEYLYKISREICDNYQKKSPAGQGINSIHLQIYTEGAPKNLEESDVKFVKDNFPKLANRINDIQVVKNGYLYRVFYTNPSNPSVSLISTDLFVPKKGVKASELLKD